MKFEKKKKKEIVDDYDFIRDEIFLFTKISEIDISTRTDLSYMFENGFNLEELDLSGMDTSRVESMYNMFSDCFSMKKIDLSMLDTSNVITMSRMFNNCFSLETIDMSTCDLRKCKSFNDIFDNCSCLKTVYLSENGKGLKEYIEANYPNICVCEKEGEKENE